MIKVCMFDMGGILIRNCLVGPKLLASLGFSETSFSHMSPLIQKAIHSHSKGEITEAEFWEVFSLETGTKIPNHEGSLLGKYFEPTLDEPTLAILKALKAQGYRVICGTNVNDAHYTINQKLHYYDIFDAVYASHLMHQAKPDGSFYQVILEQEHIQPNQMFFSDDTLRNIESAKELGLAAYLYTDAVALLIQLRELGILS